MPISISRLRNSTFVVKVAGDAFPAALLLWLSAWHEVPAASLPNDDEVLAALAGLGRGRSALTKWRKLRPEALYGWFEAKDGRLYHPVLAELACEALAKKYTQDRVKSYNAEKQKRYRDRIKSSGIWLEEDEQPHHDVNDDGNDDGNGDRRGIGNVTPQKGRELESKGQEKEIEGSRSFVSFSSQAASRPPWGGSAKTVQDRPSAPPNYTSDFEAFWKAYPKPVSKPAAFAAYVAATKGLGAYGAAIILAGARRYADVCGKQNTKYEFIPAPARWLSERRWEDEHENIPFNLRAVNRDPGIFSSYPPRHASLPAQAPRTQDDGEAV